MAGDWAMVNFIDVLAMPADWARYGRRAGAVRNQRMLDEARPELVVAFPGGTGTADMVRRTHAAGIPLLDLRSR